MSNVWFNIRIGVYHLQIKYGRWFRLEVSKNDYWCGKWVKSPLAFYDFDIIRNIRWGKEG